MFGSLADAIDEWLRELLANMIGGNLEAMFTDVNERVGEIATEVALTPSEWNNNILTLLRNLSENAIMPIAAMIITFVLSYELISLLIDKNNMKDVDVSMIFKYIVKSWIAVYLLANAFDFTMAVFDIASHVVNMSQGVISGSTEINVENTMPDMIERLKELPVGTLLLLLLETFILRFVLMGISILISVILYGRMVEIFFYCTIAPIPFATLTNREWGSIGNNYIRALFALAFQAFFIMVAVAIYALLIHDISLAEIEDIHRMVINAGIYTILLVVMLFKTHGISKAIFNAQ